MTEPIRKNKDNKCCKQKLFCGCPATFQAFTKVLIIYSTSTLPPAASILDLALSLMAVT